MRRAHGGIVNTAAVTLPPPVAERLKTAQPRAQLRPTTPWYRIDNNASAGVTVIRIFDEIGYWGTTAADFIRDLDQVSTQRIELHLNSPGGEAFEGVAIYNALKQHAAQVHVYIDGLAASIASVIAQAGDRIIASTGATMMIHDASGIEVGNAEDLRKYADLLDAVSNNIASIYAARAGGTVESWRALMRATTWYTAEEAVVAGLADELDTTAAAPDPLMARTWDLAIFAVQPPARPVAQPVAEATPAEPAVVEPTPAPAATPVEQPTQPAGRDAADEAAPPDLEPDTPPEPAPDPAPDHVDGLPDQRVEQPVDGWAGLTAGLLASAAPPTTTDDVFAAARKALLT